MALFLWLYSTVHCPLASTGLQLKFAALPKQCCENVTDSFSLLLQIFRFLFLLYARIGGSFKILLSLQDVIKL